jgi:CAAX protease family protein
MRLTGMPLPDPIKIPFFLAPVFFIMFFISAAGEELGWSGYAIDPMQDRWGALTASVIIGVVWQIWHVIGDLQAHNPANWIVWHGLYSVPLRILMVWIYNNTGKSVFAAILVHNMDDVSWSLFPNYGSGYNPFITGMITIITAIIVAAIWGTKTLAWYR